MLTRLYIKYFAEVKIAPAQDAPPLVKEEGEYQYDPKKDPEKELIMDEVADQLVSIRYDKDLQIKKLKYMVCCSISNVVAIILTLWGLSVTVVFDHYKKNLTMFYCSFIFYVPFLLWLRILFLPNYEEYRRRQYIVERRNWRERVKRVHFTTYMGWHDEKEETKEEREKRLKEERAKAMSLKIGKNVPKLGQGDSPVKRKDYSTVSTPTRGMNVVLDRHGQQYVRPPPIIPDQILQTGTATKLPDFTPNKYNRYKFEHPDPEGEAFGAEILKLTKLKRGLGVTFDV